jgi:hypothetical protein
MHLSGDVGAPDELEPEVEDALSSASGDSDLEEGEMALNAAEAWWEVRREWAEALEEAGPAAPVHAPLLRTVRQGDFYFNRWVERLSLV